MQQSATESAETDLRSDALSVSDIVNRLGQNVPQVMIDELPDALPITSTKIGFYQRSGDGTGKLLIDLCDNQQVETCVMQHTSSSNGKTRATICVSSQVALGLGLYVRQKVHMYTERGGGVTVYEMSVRSMQVGCQMGCTFCATGTMGHLGDLACCEIVEQVWHAMRVSSAPIRNVVFMGR